MSTNIQWSLAEQFIASFLAPQLDATVSDLINRHLMMMPVAYIIYLSYYSNRPKVHQENLSKSTT
jgi:hypothetical protein